VCLKLECSKVGKRVGITNEGYWGIPVKPQTTYRASFYAKAADKLGNAFTVSIESNNGSAIYATAQVSQNLKSMAEIYGNAHHKRM